MVATRGDRESAAHLSDDLILEILLKVSYKPIFKCKCVCKSWESLISDLSFKKRYLAAPNSTGVFFVNMESVNFNFDSVDQSYFEFASKDISTDTQIDTSLKFLPCSVIVVTSHCGFLLCVVNPKTGSTTEYHDFQYIVCNPLTKQWVNIPKNGYQHRLNDTTLFCYESLADKYTEFTLVCFVYIPDYYIMRKGVVFTYSSETRNWKRSEIPFPYNVSQSDKIVYRESLYFCYGLDDILVYDWKKESACLIDLPMPKGSSSSSKSKCLGDLDGSLYYASKEQTCICVWVLEDDSVNWSFKHNISFSSIGGYCSLLAFHPISPHQLFFESVYPSSSFFLHNVSTEKTEVISSNKLAFGVPVVPYCLSAWNPISLRIARRD